MPPQRPHPTGHLAGRHRRGRGTFRGNLLAIEPYTRHALDRLVAAAGLGLLATLASAPVALRGDADERAHDEAADGYHRVLRLVRHVRYDIAHVGGASIGIAAMIIAELVGTVALIAMLIGWAERRKTRSRPGASTTTASHRDGKRGEVSPPTHTVPVDPAIDDTPRGQNPT